MNAVQLCSDSFHTDVTAEAVRAKIGRKSAILQQRGHFDPKFLVQLVPPPIIFAQLVRPMNALQLCPDSFHTAFTAESVRAKIGRKSAILHQRGHFDPKFLVKGVPPPIIFAQLVRPMNALQLCR